jgi:uncharacterized protein involved in exopolysaccharide biosynthesis
VDDERTNKQNFRDLMRVAFRRRWIFLLGASAFAFSALWFAPAVIKPKYSGEAKFQRRSDSASEHITAAESESFETLKKSLVHELADRESMEIAVEELGLTRGMPRDRDGMLTEAGRMARQELVADLRDSVKVKYEVQSEQFDLVAVSFTDSDPVLAQRLPNVLVKNYINNTSREIITRLTASMRWLESEANKSRLALDELIQQRIDFETAHAGMLPDKPGALQKEVDTLLSDIDTVRRQKESAERQLEQLREMAHAAQNQDEPTRVHRGPNPELARLKEMLREREEELTSSRTLHRMTDEHPRVVRLKERIDELRQEIERTPQEIVLERVFGQQDREQIKVHMAAVESDVTTTTRELQRMEARLSKMQQLLGNFAPTRKNYLSLLKKIDEAEAELKRWQDRLTGVEMALAAEVAARRTHLETVQLAEMQFLPSSPSLIMLIGFALAGGLAFGAALVVLAAKLDRSIATTDDAIESLGLPVLGTVDEIVTPGRRLRRRLGKLVLVPVIAILVLTALALGGLQSTLWLRYPQKYEQWKNSPVAFVCQEVGERLGQTERKT